MFSVDVYRKPSYYRCFLWMFTVSQSNIGVFVDVYSKPGLYWCFLWIFTVSKVNIGVFCGCLQKARPL